MIMQLAAIKRKQTAQFSDLIQATRDAHQKGGLDSDWLV